MSDFDLVGGEVSPLGAGRPITIARMKGRSRAYTLSARNPPGKTAISVAFNDRCDMIVATAVLPHDRPATIELGIIEFLNGETVLHWAEVALGHIGSHVSFRVHYPVRLKTIPDTCWKIPCSLTQGICLQRFEIPVRFWFEVRV
jgi:hypothetical protein